MGILFPSRRTGVREKEIYLFQFSFLKTFVIINYGVPFCR